MNYTVYKLQPIYHTVNTYSHFSNCSFRTVYQVIVRCNFSYCPPAQSRRYNTGTMSSFEQRLIIQTFNSTPNLRILVFDIAREIDISALLANNIHHLQKLVSFQYNYRCADHVVQQLALHCSRLSTIDVSNSRAVTDRSVQYLLKLHDLKVLDLTGTSVTERKYELLLSGLPNITKIHYSSSFCDF